MAITKEQLDEYIKAYQQGRPLISDEEYDLLKKKTENAGLHSMAETIQCSQ